MAATPGGMETHVGLPPSAWSSYFYKAIAGLRGHLQVPPPPGGVLCQRGWAALMASEGCFQGWRPPASPTPRSGLVQVGCYTPYVWLLPWREQYPLFPGQNSVLQDQGHRTLIFKCSLTLLRGPSTHGSDSFPSQDQDTCFPHVG